MIRDNEHERDADASRARAASLTSRARHALVWSIFENEVPHDLAKIYEVPFEVKISRKALINQHNNKKRKKKEHFEISNITKKQKGNFLS